MESFAPLVELGVVFEEVIFLEKVLLLSVEHPRGSILLSEESAWLENPASSGAD